MIYAPLTPVISLARCLADLSELVQLKLNIGASDGDSTPSEEKRGTPTYRSGGLKKLDQN